MMHGHLNVKLVEYVLVCFGALSVVKCAVVLCLKLI
jgi:hypothetical protein